MVNRVSLPSAVCSFGMSARTAFETATVLPLDVFVTEIVSAGLPLTREMLVVGLSVRTTFATVDNVV